MALAKQITTGLPKWEADPRNEPQVEAYNSDADILLYGGKPFGGKSELILGLARYEHRNSLLIRRSFPELESGMIQRSKDFYGDNRRYNGSKYVWNLDKKRIRFGYGEKRNDFLQYKGPNWDFIGIDEASEIPRFDDGSTVIDLLLPWNRTTLARQRVRMVLGTNPGGVGEEWLMEWFRPWLDETCPEPAFPGELRWVERSGGGELIHYTEKRKGLKSMTFIESSWENNPYAGEDYEKNIELLPEPLRSQLMKGLWGVGAGDDIWQVIPSAWVKMAQDRWTERHDHMNKWDAAGVDVAMGGADNTVLSCKTDSWFAPLRKWQGKKTPDGKAAAVVIYPFLEDVRCPVLVDAFGYGADCYGELKGMGIHTARAHFGGDKTEAKERNGKLGFANTRAEAWWRLREALDPQDGADIALPPDRKLFVDLTSVRWKQHPKGIAIEKKEELIKRLGRSPDDGDAVVMCWYAGWRNVSKQIMQAFGGESTKQGIYDGVR